MSYWNKFVLSAAIGLTTVTTSVAAGAAGTAHNWMREYVNLRGRAMLERAIGPERVAALPTVSTKIVGGTTASPNANPFQVGLLTRSIASNFDAQFCGGTLIRSNVVVTAAHCSDFVLPNQVQVLTGTRNLDGTGTRRNVLSIIVHPNWNPATNDSDVAVWILKTHAGGIERPPLVSLAQEQTSGQTLVTGWGNTETAGFPIALRQAIVPLQPKADCNDPDSYNGAVTTNMICAGLDAGGSDTCQGDSGGPLTMRPAGGTGGVGTYDILTGITSWGIGCADPELFGIYTRVAKFRSWIIQQIP